MPRVATQSRRDRGRMRSRSTGLPTPYLVQNEAGLPILQVEADQVWPDVKLIPAIRARRRRRRRFWSPDRRGGGLLPHGGSSGRGCGREPLKTGPDGTFHLERLEPDALVVALGPRRRRDDRRRGRGPTPGGQGKDHPRGRSEERRPDPRAGGGQWRPAGRRGQGHAPVGCAYPVEKGKQPTGSDREHVRDGHDRRPTAGSCSGTSGLRLLYGRGRGPGAQQGRGPRGDRQGGRDA